MKSYELFDPKIDIEPTERDLKKIARGCLPRSLESAFNVLLTEKEWDYRLAQTDLLRSTSGKWRLLDSKDPLKRQLIEAEYLTEIYNLLTLITEFRNHPTPLGKALSEHQAMFISGNGNLVKTYLDQGHKKVLLAMPHHIMHIGRVPETGTIRSLSDTSRRLVNLNPLSARRDMLVFTPLH